MVSQHDNISLLIWHYQLVEADEVSHDRKEAKKIQKIDNGIESQKMVYSINPEQWEKVISWGVEQNFVNQKDIGILQVATKIPNQIPTEKQSIYLMKLLDRFKENGFQL